MQMKEMKYEYVPIFEGEEVRPFDLNERQEQEYAAFVDKFKPKKTTDECYTPPEVYEVVKTWLGEQIDLEGRTIVRPFYPGGNYQGEEYPEGCLVLDNPPFSILSDICRFYAARGISYFLFAPTLTLFCLKGQTFTSIVCNAEVTYDNGAVVSTSFRTNLFPDLAIWVAGDLTKRIIDVQKKPHKPQLPKYDYPDHVITAARLGSISKQGLTLKIARSEVAFISGMDAQKALKKSIYGSGFLISSAAAERAATARAAAERAAAERAATARAAAERAATARAETAIVWELSPHERAIIHELDKRKPPFFLQKSNNPNPYNNADDPGAPRQDGGLLHTAPVGKPSRGLYEAAATRAAGVLHLLRPSRRRGRTARRPPRGLRQVCRHPRGRRRRDPRPLRL